MTAKSPVHYFEPTDSQTVSWQLRLHVLFVTMTYIMASASMNCQRAQNAYTMSDGRACSVIQYCISGVMRQPMILVTLVTNITKTNIFFIAELVLLWRVVIKCHNRNLQLLNRFCNVKCQSTSWQCRFHYK